MWLLLNGLLFVSPFIMVAHGVFLEGHFAMALGILGIATSKAQLEILKRRLPKSFVFGRLPVFAWGAVSLVGALCCMPASFIRQLSPDLTRGDFVGLVFAAVALGAVGTLRDARAGLVAALGVAIFAGLCGVSGTLALNAAILFLFVHQLRWQTMSRDEQLVLAIAGVVWIAQTLGLEFRNSIDLRAPGLVATIVAIVCLRNAWFGRQTSLVPPICLIIVLCLHPIHWSAKTAATAPSGVLEILMGFALLAAGAWDSMRRWQRQR
jgi:hypothetical protein